MKNFSPKVFKSDHAWVALLLYDLRDYSLRNNLGNVADDIEKTLRTLVDEIEGKPGALSDEEVDTVLEFPGKLGTLKSVAQRDGVGRPQSRIAAKRASRSRAKSSPA